MSDTALRVERLGKHYRIGSAPRKRYRTFGDALVQTVSAPLRNLRWLRGLGAIGRGEEHDVVWALRDVSFQLKHGEVLGVIGRNGAGKSTLLKVLSRITKPSTGEARVRGRVGALLEVGTGFHPELTGRDNVYLNGSILGMDRAYIDRRFDEIVEFSGVERFIDTPVKRYSSGMYLRLAFSVAAHLEPEILIVDEVLAVGDAEFQKKCLGKMEETAQEGRTVLFVSHNMAAVEALCGRAILLQDGTVHRDGPVREVVAAYLHQMERGAERELEERTDRRGRGAIRVRRLSISPGEGAPPGALVTGRPARFAFHLTGAAPDTACTFTIYDERGQPVASLSTPGGARGGAPDALAEPVVACEMDELLLVPGRYRVNVAVHAAGELQDHVEAAVFFDVDPGQVGGRTVADTGYGSVWLPHRWTYADPVPAGGA